MNTIALVFIGLVFGVVVSHAFELTLMKSKRMNNRYYRNHEIIFGYHIHHSMYGLGTILVGSILLLIDYQATAIFLIATGFGIIIMHTFFDGRIIFIEKE